MGQGAATTDLVLRSPDAERLRLAADRVRAMVVEAHRAAGLSTEIEVY